MSYERNPEAPGGTVTMQRHSLWKRSGTATRERRLWTKECPRDVQGPGAGRNLKP